jgi:hypothetical protein
MSEELQPENLSKPVEVSAETSELAKSLSVAPVSVAESIAASVAALSEQLSTPAIPTEQVSEQVNPIVEPIFEPAIVVEPVAESVVEPEPEVVPDPVPVKIDETDIVHRLAKMPIAEWKEARLEILKLRDLLSAKAEEVTTAVTDYITAPFTNDTQAGILENVQVTPVDMVSRVEADALLVVTEDQLRNANAEIAFLKELIATLTPINNLPEAPPDSIPLTDMTVAPETTPDTDTVQNLQTALSELQNKFDVQAASYATLKGNNVNSMAYIAELKATVAELKVNSDKIEVELAKSKDEVAQLQAKLDSAGKKPKSKAGKLSSLFKS